MQHDLDIDVIRTNPGGLPAVIAMQYENTDRAAIEFALSLYDALADGLPIDAAVSEARKAVQLDAPHFMK